MPHKSTISAFKSAGRGARLVAKDLKKTKGSKVRKRLSVGAQVKALRDLPGQRKRTQASQEQATKLQARLGRQTRRRRPKPATKRIRLSKSAERFLGR